MKNKQITAASNFLVGKYKIGIQYEWFALFCNFNNINMEIGIESPLSTIGDAIYGEGSDLIEIKNDFLNDRLKIKRDSASSELIALMGNFILPITKYSKKDMENIAREKNWLDIMKLTWFCHNPINNKPCGYCNPCKDAMAYEMEWRMPFISKIRYYLMSPLMLMKAFVKKLLGK